MSPIQQKILYALMAYLAVLLVLAIVWLARNSIKVRDFSALKGRAQNYQPWWLCPFSRQHMRLWRAVVWIGGLSWLAAGLIQRL